MIQRIFLLFIVLLLGGTVAFAQAGSTQPKTDVDYWVDHGSRPPIVVFGPDEEAFYQNIKIVLFPYDDNDEPSNPSALALQRTANATTFTSQLNIQAQTACEAGMLREMGAREVFSGKAYDVLTEISRAYGRAIPHIYIFPGSSNMAYIAASIAVDGRGKILVGQQATEVFDNISLKGFLGHEMAHLVSDAAAHGCNDYVLRDPQMEAEADALAARTLGKQPVEAFLERVLAFTEGQNWEAKRRLEMLQ
jgi:hypothetical protein